MWFVIQKNKLSFFKAVTLNHDSLNQVIFIVMNDYSIKLTINV